MHVLLRHTAHFAQIRSFSTIEPHDLHTHRSILTTQLLLEACGAEHVIVDDGEASLAAELATLGICPLDC